MVSLIIAWPFVNMYNIIEYIIFWGVTVLEFITLDIDFSVCKIKDTHNIDFTRTFVFLSKTDEELSLVCESVYVPPDAIAVEDGWKAFRIAGILDFGLIGIIANITKILAEAEISVFVVSTYNTDYIFLKSKDFDKGLALIKQKYKEAV